MKIQDLKQRHSKSISLLDEYEEAKEFENERVKYEVIPIYEASHLNFIIFDKQHREVYFGGVSEVLNWFKTRSIEPFASEVFVRKAYEHIWYSKNIFEKYN